MDSVIFIYNLMLSILYTFVFSISAFLYFSQKQKQFLYMAILAIVLFVQNSLLYMTEFISSFSQLYINFMQNTALTHTICSAGIIICIRYIIADAFNIDISKTEKVFFVFAIFTMLIYPFLPFHIFIFYMFFTINQLIFAYLIWLVIQKIRKITHPNALIKKIKYICYFLMAVNISIACEDAYVIYFLDFFSDQNAFIHLRNISEDIRNITLCLSLIYYCIHIAIEQNNIEKRTIDINLAEKISIVAQHYHLTKREYEIVSLLFEEKSNQEIADELYISLATLKTHVHHIYQKCNISGRLQLIQMIQKIHSDNDIK